MRIEHWSHHLPKMVNSYYEIDGVVGKMYHFKLIDKQERVLLQLTTRDYEYSWAEMPEALKTWRPVDKEDKPSYNFILAEKAITNVGVIITPHEEIHHDAVPDLTPQLTEAIEKVDTDQSAFQTQIENAYSMVMQDMIDNSKYVKEKLKDTILQLKQPNGNAFVPQAKQIINAINALSNDRDGLIEFFKTGVNMSKAHGKTKDSDNKTNSTK